MPRLNLRRLALLLPIVFVLHVIEETPRFVPWFNELARPPITLSLFLSVNAVALVITCGVAVLVATVQETLSAVVGVAWVGFLMLANGLFHIVATIAHERYCPGVLTGTILYLPLSALFLRAVVHELGWSRLAVASTALLGGIPMYIHGYLIVFEGGRLF